MNSFFRAHRFKIVISILVVIFMIVSFFMILVHIPYSSHENSLTNIRNEIISKNNYEYDNYMNKHNSDQVYYILKVKDKDEGLYVVFDQNLNLLDSISSDIADEKICKEAFKEKYKCEADKIEIGYENKTIVYSLRYKGKDHLIYAFYRVDNGEFIKAYQL